MENQQPSDDAEIESIREKAEIVREIADAIRMFAEERDGGALRDVLQRHGDDEVQDALLGAANVLEYAYRRAVLDF